MSSALLRTDVPPSFLAHAYAYVPADYGVPQSQAPWTAAAPVWGSPALFYQPPVGITAPALGSINAIYLPPAAAAPQQAHYHRVASLPSHQHAAAALAPPPPPRPVQQHTDWATRPSSAAAVATFTAGLTKSGESQSDDAEGAKQRCIKCRAYFTAQENVDGACRYHPGHYFTPDTAGPIMMPAATLLRWSCCKSPSADSPGCRQQRHVVDRTTAAILRQFGPSARLREGLTPTASGNLTRGATGDGTNHDDPRGESPSHPGLTDEEERLRVALGRMQVAGGGGVAAAPGALPAEGGVVMVRHPVSKTDTLAGVSLRYGVKVDEIKQANNLTSQSIFGHKYLLIPNPARQPTPDELATAVPPRDGKKSIALARFRSMTGCAVDEAQYYLDEHDLDLARAVAAYQADLQWEQNAPLPRKTTTVITGPHMRRR